MFIVEKHCQDNGLDYYRLRDTRTDSVLVLMDPENGDAFYVACTIATGTAIAAILNYELGLAGSSS